MRRSGHTGADRYEGDEQRRLKQSEGEWRKTRCRGVAQADWSGVEREDWRRERVIGKIKSREWQVDKRIRGEVMQVFEDK